MTKDGVFKWIILPAGGGLFTTLLGAGVAGSPPVRGGLAGGLYCAAALVLACRFSIGLLRRLRSRPVGSSRLLGRAAPLFAAVTAGVAAFGLLSGLWSLLTGGIGEGQGIGITTISCAAAIGLLTLGYEIQLLAAAVQQQAAALAATRTALTEAQIRSLGLELEPHFLFNCLTILAQLAPLHPQRAAEFTHSLAALYQYLLLIKGKNRVSLEEELAFVAKYVTMLHYRFGDQVQIRQAPGIAEVAGWLPPGALQVTVENAVKHTAFSPESPLVITITAGDSHLCVSNPFRPKVTLAAPTKTGLANLAARYRLTMDAPLIIRQSPEEFVVTLPFKKYPYDQHSDN